MKGGDFDEGMETIRAGLSLALEHELTLEAAEVYQRLGTAHEIAGDYGGARNALATAMGFCETNGAEAWSTHASAAWPTCCASWGLGARQRALDRASRPGRRRGRHARRGRRARVDPRLPRRGFGRPAAARPVPRHRLAPRRGLDERGQRRRARRARRARGRPRPRPRRHCRFLLERWARSEDHHYAVWGLRWASCFFARHGLLGEARACAQALSSIATTTGHPDALAALAYALGETALAEGDADAAAQQIEPRGRSSREPRDPVRASADPAPSRRGARRGGAA